MIGKLKKIVLIVTGVVITGAIDVAINSIISIISGSNKIFCLFLFFSALSRVLFPCHPKNINDEQCLLTTF